MGFWQIVTAASPFAVLVYLLWRLSERVKVLEGEKDRLWSELERQDKARRMLAQNVTEYAARARDLDASLRLGTVDPTGAHGYAEPPGYLAGRVDRSGGNAEPNYYVEGGGKDA